MDNTNLKVLGYQKAKQNKTQQNRTETPNQETNKQKNKDIKLEGLAEAQIWRAKPGSGMGVRVDMALFHCTQCMMFSRIKKNNTETKTLTDKRIKNGVIIQVKVEDTEHRNNELSSYLVTTSRKRLWANSEQATLEVRSSLSTCTHTRNSLLMILLPSITTKTNIKKVTLGIVVLVLWSKLDNYILAAFPMLYLSFLSNSDTLISFHPLTFATSYSASC